MSQNTSTDIYLNKEVSQDKIDSFNLSRHLIELLWNEPFYSRILRSLTNIETEEIPTAGVLCKDNDIKMWWNKKFFASLSDLEIKGVLKHECLHLVYNHTTDRKREPHKVWNYATDLAINSLISIKELPEFCLRPAQRLPELTPEQSLKMSIEAIQAYNDLSDQIEKFPLNKTSEYYFEELMKTNAIQKLDEHMKGEGDFNMQFDDHDGWDELSQDEKEYFKQKIKDIIKSATNEASKNGWGSVSNELRKELAEMFSNTINWKELLKRFCAYTKSNDRLSSIKKSNRKYPNIHPGVKKDYRPTIAVYVDESGSMCEDTLNKVYSELSYLSRNTDFYLYKFDTQVDESSGFLWKKGKRFPPVRHLSGGTCFNAPTNHAIKNKSKFDGYLILTDGCAAKPNFSNGLKRGFILIPNSNLFFEKDTKDFVIKMQ
jgi:predicted metal-dependent peptidase